MKGRNAALFALIKAGLTFYLLGLCRLKSAEARARVRFCKQVSALSGIGFCLESLSLNIRGKITVKGVKLQLDRPVPAAVSIAAVAIGFRLREILKRNLRPRYLHIDTLEVVCEPPAKSDTATATATPASDSKGAQATHATHASGKYYSLIARGWRLFFAYLPPECRLNKARMVVKLKAQEHSLAIENLLFREQEYTLEISASLVQHQPFLLKGSIRTASQQITLHELKPIAPPQEPAVLQAQDAGGPGSFLLRVERTAHHAFRLYVSIHEMELSRSALAATPVSIHHLELAVDANLKRGFFTIEDSSKIIFNQLACGLYLRHTFFENTIKVKVDPGPFTAEQIRQSFPNFICEELYKLPCSGDLSLAIFITIPLGDLAATAYQTRFDSHNFSIADTTNTVFSLLGTGFRSSSFVALSAIPQPLRQIIISTEDPNFFAHKGIDLPFLGYALLQNVKQRRVARGGSTITMQLARNLYLGHKKNIYRKLEEIIISWLLETIFQLPKERILELYFNIIEFAPGVYGIKAGCEYYFFKRPEALTLTECMVLSYIIPRPKHFDEAVEIGSDQLKRNLAAHVQTVSWGALQRGIITQKEFTAIPRHVLIKGRMIPLESPGTVDKRPALQPGTTAVTSASAG